MRSLMVVALGLAVGTVFGGEPLVFPRGAKVRLPVQYEAGETEGFRAWSLSAYVSNVPEAFRRQNAARIRENRSEPQYGSINLLPYAWTSVPPKEVEVDVTGWPAGDYRLTLTALLRRDGKDSYPQKGLAFSLRETEKSAPAGAVDEIPFAGGFSGNPQGAAAVDLPWRGGFTLMQSHAVPQARTRYKAFHDNDWLYFAIEAEEPVMMEEIRKMPKVGYESYLISEHGRDALEVNVDPTGKGLSFYKIIVNPTGDLSDLRGEDDNTNTGRYTFDSRWCSRARTAVAFGEKSWTLEIAIPFGAFGDLPADPAAKWGFAVGRQRFVAATKTRKRLNEYSISVPSDSLCEGTAFPKSALARWCPKAHVWDVSSVKTSVAPKDGGLGLTVSATVFNRTGDWRNARLVASAEDKFGKTVATAETALPASPDALLPVSVCLAPVPRGETALRLEIFGADGILEKGFWTPVKVAYEPIRITLTKPAYRDFVYDSMHLTELEGFVTLETGLGRPLELTLTGPGTEERVRFDRAGERNSFRIPFRNKAKGDYFLKVGNVTKRVRNLPFKAGEIWLDATGVAYREGVKILPFGYFNETFTHMYPGLTIAQSYAPRIKDPAWIAARCATAHSNDCGFIISPYQDFLHKEASFQDLYGNRAKQGEFGKGKFGELQKKGLRLFAETTRDQPGFFAFYMDDEPEGRGTNPDFHAEARKYLMEIDPYHPAIMLNYSIEGMRRYCEGGDILAPDAYPVYYDDGGTMAHRRCSYDKAKVASEYGCGWLVPQAFDWSRADGDRWPRGPKYSEMREQCLMGLAGDARGFMFYIRDITQESGYQVELGVRLVLEEITEARDAFLAPTHRPKQTVAPEKAAVFSALKSFGGDTVLIVVNSERFPCRAELAGAELPKKLYLTDCAEPIEVAGGRLALELGPLESRVYRAKPWKFSLKGAQAAVDAAEASRRKPGNLCVAKKFRNWREIEKRGEAGVLREGPRFASSTSYELYDVLDQLYFLQDGRDQDLPWSFYQGWRPGTFDKKPWVRCDFGEKKTFSKIVLTRVRDQNGNYYLFSGSVEANGREIARFGDLKGGKITLEFPPVEADSFTVRIGEWKADRWHAILSEIEAY